MTVNSISPDTKVTLLLCNRLGQPDVTSDKILNTAEYAEICKWLHNQSMNLSDLFEQKVVDQYAIFSRMNPKRLHALLNRGGALALAIEEWTNKGIWILSPRDENYPKRLTERLSEKAPPLLFGTGNADLLSKGGLAVVGSRDIGERAKMATHQIGHLCAQSGIQLISGGARGVDNEGMQTVLDEGGQVIGFVADSLLKMSVNGKYRQGLREKRLVLVTSNDPKTPFNVGNAMARNKFVYCLSDWTVVIASSFNEGGTWAGAIENLKNKWVPMFVRKDVDVPEGNYRLLDKGGIPLSSDSFSTSEHFMQILKDTAATFRKFCVSDQSEHYSTLNNFVKECKNSKIIIEPISTPPHNATGVSQDAVLEQSNHDLFPVVWPFIEKELQHPRTERELAEMFKIELKQIKSWLSVAVEQGRVIKLSKPTRYVKAKETNSLTTWIKN
jgi:predicted Rossmann fold nucleotide-binding protein DprA/Smf involved in DNA uptake